MSKKLNDDEVYDRLHAAFLALGKEQAESVAGQTTIATARLALESLQKGFLMAIESDDDRNTAIIDPSRPLAP
jgi:hypothetical protein